MAVRFCIRITNIEIHISGGVYMGNIKWIFVLYSVLAAVSLMGIAISISLASPLLSAGSIIALTIIMGFGFTTKKRYREEGRL
jgi:Family of unknown function (DUF5325)